MENCVSACRRCNDHRNHTDILAPGHKCSPPKVQTLEQILAALHEVSKQRDAAVEQLERQRAINLSHLSELKRPVNEWRA
jgi:hypothetical protein